MYKQPFSIYILYFCLFINLTSCSVNSVDKQEDRRYEFGNLFNLSYTPKDGTYCNGWFTDAGSWMGFTIPNKENWINGFCGPFSLDMKRRQWMAKCAVEVGYVDYPSVLFIPDSTNCFPGEIYISSNSSLGKISQRLNFINSSTALLRIKSDKEHLLSFKGDSWAKDCDITSDNNAAIIRHQSGEIICIAFQPNIKLQISENNYFATSQSEISETIIAISFIASEQELIAVKQKSFNQLNNYQNEIMANKLRWNNYINKTLRNDMKYEYDRIAVKAVSTLISNWRVRRGGLLHDGIVPSHAVDYFVGFWAWDSWRFSAALAKFEPQLAKNNIRAMFDYQQPDGMVIDCIYTDPSENNARNSKPPLACWAVDEIFNQTKDTAFVKEMYPQLLAYYKWWFKKRDNDNNGICEYGSTDGTLEAAAWESGMDNAIRFDNASMLKNEGYDDAWSCKQESVDLNCYLALECKLLKKFAKLINVSFNAPDYSIEIADYFYSKENNFFFDKCLLNGNFIKEYGCEAYTPLWTQVAKSEQVDKMVEILKDSTKFSTYIPFPTIAADNPKYNKRGYWRGPIWLDQTYFAIRGLRNYGYKELADKYTLQVFDRLQGLISEAPIHENYDTHTGERLKAPHFSWSSSHLLMLYDDYNISK